MIVKMSAMLRVTGPFQELSAALRTVSLKFSESIASTKARERNDSTDDGRSTFNLTVSDADGDRVPQQIAECESFFEQHEAELSRLRKLSCVENICLDFMWFFPRSSQAQFNRLTSSFMKKCGEFGVDIELSVYACADSDV